jgi:hypothetical protein
MVLVLKVEALTGASVSLENLLEMRIPRPAQTYWIQTMVVGCFAKSFHFRFWFKGFVNKINHSFYTNKYSKYLLENYRAYFQYTNIKREIEIAEDTSPNWSQHAELNSAGKSQVTAHLESHLGKGPRQHVWSVCETSKIAVQSSTINPRIQIDTITNVWANCKPGFMVMLFVLSCTTRNVVKPGTWLARPLQGLNHLHIHLPSYLWCCKFCTHCRQSFLVTHSQGSVQAG